MMTKLLFLFVTVIVICQNTVFGQNQDDRTPARFVEIINDNIANGEYSYRYNAGTTDVRQQGQYQPDGEYRVEGAYYYYDPLSNKSYSVTYFADKNGYRPRFTVISYGPDSPPSGFGGLGPRTVATMIG